MYNDNSRFEDLGNGTITELIAGQTQLFYDPTTQGCRVIFNGNPFIQIVKADLTTSYLPVGQNADILNVDLNDQMTRCLCVAGDVDPVTGADLSQISVAGILGLMKRAYNTYHNENYAAIQQAIADAEAAQNPPEQPAP